MRQSGGTVGHLKERRARERAIQDWRDETLRQLDERRRFEDEDTSVLTVPIRADRPGTLPCADEAACWTVAEVELPSGHLVFSKPADGTQTLPLAWVSDHPVRDARTLWVRLAAAFDQTGLWPLASKGLDGLHSGLMRAWSDPDDTFDPPGDVDTVDTLAFLRARFGDCQTEDPPVSITFAERTQWPQARLTISRTFVEPDSVIVLVPCTRPADAWNATGWTGALCNHDITTTQASAVLRSWEDRFGAVLTNIGFDTISLAVASPPKKEQLLAVAAEHEAFCPDIIVQGIDDLAAYAELREDCNGGRLWWD
jgi:hypothetical protein